MKRTAMLFGACLGFGLVSQDEPVQADPVADFYKAQTLTFLLGFPPGGGYDTYGRTLMRHFYRHVPGTPTVVVQNMPGGGGGLRAANHVYNVSARDGSVMAMFAATTIFEPLFGSDSAKFDPSKFTWIGNIDQTTGTCVAWEGSGIASFDDLLVKETLFGASGASSILAQHPAAFRNLFDAKAKVVKGYAGTNEVVLAMQRGEVRASCAMALSSLKVQWVEHWKSGRMTVFVQLGTEPNPELPGVSHIYSYAKTEEDRQVLDLVFGLHVLGRPVAAPPGLPADRARALRQAFMATMKDPAFVGEAQKLNLDVSPLSGDRVEEVISRYFSYSKAVVAKAAEATKSD